MGYTTTAEAVEPDTGPTPAEIAAESAWYWAFYNAIQLQSGTFQMDGHTWQAKIMDSRHPYKVGRKAAQLGYSELEILTDIHGLIHGYYPTGVLYLFPTGDDVSDYSKARFGPLISSNPSISRYVASTDSTNIKKIGRGLLYLRGARLQKIDGMKEDSAKLRSVPVDKVVFDERDLISGLAVDMALERMSHSKVQARVSFSTPTIPNFGIDAEYEASNKQVWMIRCTACNDWTCLELEFPNCVTDDGKRICKKCGREIHPVFGEWVAEKPSVEDIEGYWISQLNSPFINPGVILKLFNNPPNGNIQEVYNSKLGMPYIAAENQLTKNDVYECCGMDPMLKGAVGPCAMGVDVGRQLHVFIGGKVGENRHRLLRVERVASFNDVHDLAHAFNVRCAVIDIEPETRTVRDFQRNEGYEIWLCDYSENPATGISYRENNKTIMAYRTEALDAVHNTVTTKGRLELPRRSAEIEQFATEMTGLAKVLETDKATGASTYRYRKLRDDHYFHAFGYYLMAAKRTSQMKQDFFREKPLVAETTFNPLEISI